MVLKTAAGAPITCLDWNNLTNEDGFLALGRNRYHCSYVIYTDGTYYYAENGATGNLDFGGPNNRGTPPVSGTDADAVIQAAQNALPLTVNAQAGGKIFIRRGIYPCDSQITINRDFVKIQGEGPSTELRNDTAGYLFDIDDIQQVAGAKGGYQSNFNYITFEDFLINATAKAVGRSGIDADRSGQNLFLNRVYMRNLDIGIQLEESHLAHIFGLVATNLDNPILQTTGTTLTTNQLTIEKNHLYYCATYGVYADYSSVLLTIKDTYIHVVDGGVPVYIDSGYEQIDINNLYTEGTGGTGVRDIYIDNSTNRTLTGVPRGINLKNCHLGMPGQVGIELRGARDIIIENLYPKNHTVASIRLYDETMGVHIINPFLDEAADIPTADDYLLDGTLTTEAGRLAGTVVRNGLYGAAFGNIVMGSAAYADGDVVVPAGIHLYATIAVANSDNPRVIMLANQNGDPSVIATSGITRVKVNGAVNVGDTLVTNNVLTEAQVNNAQTDPKKIIGYASSTKGVGVGLTYAKIL